MNEPGPTEALQRFENDEARPKALLGQMIRGADAGDARSDDQHVEVLGGRGGGGADLILDVHGGFLDGRSFGSGQREPATEAARSPAGAKARLR